MTCKYCGQECNAGATQKLWTKYGPECKASPSKMHVLISDGVHCVYCGHECRAGNGQKLWTKYGPNCKYSPTGNHVLQ